MNILRADHLGMCFGVRDAIAMAQAEARLGPLTVLGDLVHNQSVIDDLQSRGIRIAQRPGEVSTHKVMVTAHGASERAKAGTRALGLNVIEATCPLVHLAHRSLARLVAAGFHPVIVGRRDHVEVRGMTEDLDEFDVVLGEADVLKLLPRPRLGVVAQTTQPIERVRYLVRLIQQRFPEAEVRFIDTVCQPTKQRQRAAVSLARQCDVVLVIGGASSNNTRELARTCRRDCARVHQVQTAADLRPEWFHGAGTVGITAGTSTPDAIVDGVEEWLRAWNSGAPARTQSIHAL
jgi:4-hydroxy-3-methylbut-2-enyl diphosphate reductase